MEDRQQISENAMEGAEKVECCTVLETVDQPVSKTPNTHDQRGITSASKHSEIHCDTPDQSRNFPSLQSSAADLRHGSFSTTDNLDGTHPSSAMPIQVDSVEGLAPPPSAPTRPRATTMSTLKSLRTIDAERPTLRKVETRLAQVS